MKNYYCQHELKDGLYKKLDCGHYIPVIIIDEKLNCPVDICPKDKIQLVRAICETKTIFNPLRRNPRAVIFLLRGGSPGL
jgi:hypothetical protein